MPITAEAPAGGIVEQLGGESRPLVLRNGEIERFERQHNIGIFEVLDQLLGNGNPQARHCRDLVALGLVGGGLPDKTADHIVSALPPHENHHIRAIAQDLLFVAFVPPDLDKKKDSSDGSGEVSSPPDTKPQKRPKTQSERA